MLKVFISQPMRGRNDKEIKAEREAAIKWAKAQLGDVEIIDSFFYGANGLPLELLSKSIEALSKADYVLFCPGWELARGCRIEFECCVWYEKKIKTLKGWDLK